MSTEISYNKEEYSSENIRNHKQLVKDFYKLDDFILIRNNISDFNLIDKEKYIINSCFTFESKQLVGKNRIIINQNECDINKLEKVIKDKLYKLLNNDELKYYIINFSKSIEIFDNKLDSFDWFNLNKNNNYHIRVGCKIEFIFDNIMLNLFLIDIMHT